MLVYTQNSAQATAGYKVVICDDHPQMRGGLRNVLIGMLGCEVVGETAFGGEAIRLVESHRANLLILDLSLPGDMSGREVLSTIRLKRVPVKIFMHTAFLNRGDFEEWIASSDGPDGIDEKGTGDIELAIGFTQVLLTDQRYVPLRLIRKFGGRAQGKILDLLTPQEAQVLKLAIHPEFDTRNIAEQLNYSASTVRSYLSTIYAKLGLEQHSRSALIEYYYAHRDDGIS